MGENRISPSFSLKATYSIFTSSSSEPRSQNCAYEIELDEGGTKRFVCIALLHKGLFGLFKHYGPCQALEQHCASLIPKKEPILEPTTVESKPVIHDQLLPIEKQWFIRNHIKLK
ncbi:hypothetical protein HZA76_04820 [Candidatus Roizmanbacteria bacterium]|nr:hypothetical protein [Candidatus Roizmanbacteria bacterium]